MKMFRVAMAVMGLALYASISNASEMGGMSGGFGGSKIWRTSSTASNDNWVVIATGNIIIGYIQINSTGTGSSVTILQSSATGVPANLIPNFFGSSFPFTAQSTAKGWATTGEAGNNLIYVMKESTAGWGYKTTGTNPATIDILWDYKIPPR